MSCGDFVNRLQQVLDDRGDPCGDVELRRHAEACEACRERLEAQQLLFRWLPSAVRPQSGSDAGDGDVARRAHQNGVRRTFGGSRPAGRPTPVRRGSTDARRRAVGSAGSAGKIDASGPASGDRRATNSIGAARLKRLAAVALATSAALVLIVLARKPSGPESAERGRATAEATVERSEGTAGSTRNRAASRSKGELKSGGETSGERTEGRAGRGERWSALTLTGRGAGGRSTARWAPDVEAGRAALGNLGRMERERIATIYDAFCKAPPLPESSLPQVEHLAAEFRPLAQPFFSVLDILWRSLPGARTDASERSGDETTVVWRWGEIA